MKGRHSSRTPHRIGRSLYATHHNSTPLSAHSYFLDAHTDVGSEGTPQIISESVSWGTCSKIVGTKNVQESNTKAIFGCLITYQLAAKRNPLLVEGKI